MFILKNHNINRKNTYSIKWDVDDKELPIWIADIDFQTAHTITQILVKRAEAGIFGYSTISDKWYSAIIG